MDSIPAVLLGGLNVARALGMGGVPVLVGASRAPAPALASRYCRGRIDLPELDQPGAVVDALVHAGKRLSARWGTRIPLFYSNDDWQRLVQDHRSALGRYYALLLNDTALADALIDKDRFQALAEARGLPVPRRLKWDQLADFRAPVLVKPLTKLNWMNSSVFARVMSRAGKAAVFADGPALLAQPAACALQNQLVVQHYIAGDDRQIWSFHGLCDDGGQLLDWFIGRKIRTYPALTGTSTCLELAYDPQVEALGRAVVASLGLKGAFKLDLKRDAATGELYLLEINARYNLWHYLGAANGVNLPRAAYDYLLHGRRPAAAGRYRTRYRWLYLRFDWCAYRELAERGELGLIAWLGSLAGRPHVSQLFAWRDPLPFFYMAHQAALSRLPRVATRLRRWLSTAS